MNNRPTLDREFVIPVLIGGLSVVGIVVVLMIGRALNAPAEVAMTPSSTPFQFIYLGTEPAITTLVVEGSELPLSEEPITEAPIPEGPITEKPITDIPVFSTVTRPAVSTPIILTQSNPTNTVTNTPSRTPAATSSTATAGNTYDDTDLDYRGSWTGQTGVTGAYEGTLHISYIVGNSTAFTFTGTEFHLFYQAGPSLGTFTVTIDNLGDPPISQAQNTTQIKEWVSDILSSGTHTVIITHYSGGSINIDRFYIPVPTPTPTKTPTP